MDVHVQYCALMFVLESNNFFKECMITCVLLKNMLRKFKISFYNVVLPGQNYLQA